MKRAVLEAVVDARSAKRPLVVLTPLGGGDVQVWSPGEEGLAAELRTAAERALASDDAVTVDAQGGAVFVQPFNPPLRLVIVGAVHVAGPLSSIAGIVGYEVAVVDPRRAFARAERWPTGVTVSAEWPDEALGAMLVDHRTAIVALSHDPKIDDPALRAALRSPAFYVGALGSKKTHAARLGRLAAEGFGEAELARIHGPIGLAIGARSPGEIAVAIMGQMTETLRRGRA